SAALVLWAPARAWRKKPATPTAARARGMMATSTLNAMAPAMKKIWSWSAFIQTRRRKSPEALRSRRKADFLEPARWSDTESGVGIAGHIIENRVVSGGIAAGSVDAAAHAGADLANAALHLAARVPGSLAAGLEGLA